MNKLIFFHSIEQNKLIIVVMITKEYYHFKEWCWEDMFELSVKKKILLMSFIKPKLKVEGLVLFKC